MKVLVTGGGGFLGGAIVARLRARDECVRSFARGDYPELRATGVEVVRGDICDDRAVAAACAGCEAVFHAAAKAGIGGRESEYRSTNIRGTENVIAGCLRHGVQRLIYTSSPSVVFNGRDQAGIDEASATYPDRRIAAYPRTKALGERLVLASNGSRLRTIALRPHLIWGPRDTNLVPRIIARARAGRLRRIGGANPLVDSTYIDNAADAHLLAADRLEQTDAVGGRAYFISNGEPMPLWDLVNAILAAAELPPVTRSVPGSVARAAGAVFEAIYGLLRLRGEPPMTRFLAAELSHAHWFDISAARRDLGYSPGVSIAEGLRRLRDDLQPDGKLQSGS